MSKLILLSPLEKVFYIPPLWGRVRVWADFYQQSIFYISPLLEIQFFNQSFQNEFLFSPVERIMLAKYEQINFTFPLGESVLLARWGLVFSNNQPPIETVKFAQLINGFYFPPWRKCSISLPYGHYCPR